MLVSLGSLLVTFSLESENEEVQTPRRAKKRSRLRWSCQYSGTSFTRAIASRHGGTCWRIFLGGA
jgi:hypothetical protein